VEAAHRSSKTAEDEWAFKAECHGNYGSSGVQQSEIVPKKDSKSSPRGIVAFYRIPARELPDVFFAGIGV